MEKISHYDRKRGEIICLTPAQENIFLDAEQVFYNHTHNGALSKFSVGLYYGDQFVVFDNTLEDGYRIEFTEYTDVQKDFDEFVINTLGFKFIQYVFPDSGAGGYIAFRFADATEAEEIKTNLIKKIKELNLEQVAPQIDEETQTVCNVCSHYPFYTIIDFGYGYCGNCGAELPEKENWSYGNQQYIRIL